MKTVKVASTKLGKKTTISTTASAWGELRPVLVEKGWFNASTMKAILLPDKVTLEHDEAVLPDGNFNIVIVPTKNDSGNDISEEEFNDFVEQMNELIDEFREKFNEHADNISDSEGLMDEANDIEDEMRDQGIIR